MDGRPVLSYRRGASVGSIRSRAGFRAALQFVWPIGPDGDAVGAATVQRHPPPPGQPGLCDTRKALIATTILSLAELRIWPVCEGARSHFTARFDKLQQASPPPEIRRRLR